MYGIYGADLGIVKKQIFDALKDLLKLVFGVLAAVERDKKIAAVFDKFINLVIYLTALGQLQRVYDGVPDGVDAIS